MIDCPPADLHDGKTLQDALSGRNAGKVEGGRTSGYVALMKSTENKNEYHTDRKD